MFLEIYEKYQIIFVYFVSNRDGAYNISKMKYDNMIIVFLYEDLLLQNVVFSTPLHHADSLCPW